MTDAERTPRCGTTYPQNNEIHENTDPSRNSIDGPSTSSIDESPSMSRSSSKTSIETVGKPPKPRRPTNYAERKSSISKRQGLHNQPKNLNLNQTSLVSPISPRNTVPSPPVSAKTTPKTAFTPILERPQERRRIRENAGTSRSDAANGIVEEKEPTHFPLPPPTNPEKDIPKAPATRMYWHQPLTHGMMATGPVRRSHSVAQIGSTIYLIGGSDGKPPKATNTVYIFDIGMPFREVY